MDELPEIKLNDYWAWNTEKTPHDYFGYYIIGFTSRALIAHSTINQRLVTPGSKTSDCLRWPVTELTKIELCSNYRLSSDKLLT